MGNRSYRDQGFGDWTGFYDWLREPSDKVVGVRYLPFDKTRFLVDLLCSLPYVTAPKDRSYVEVYFVKNPRPDSMRSDDQAFGSNKVFYSEEGGWLLSFDTTGLSESELNSLQDEDVCWEQVSAAGKSSEDPKSVMKNGKVAKAAGST
jgi:hypothetical protein